MQIKFQGNSRQIKRQRKIKIFPYCLQMNEEKPFLRMILGGIASMCACAFTHPVDTVKVRLQKEGEGHSRNRYGNIFRAIRMIYQEEGIRAFYNGLSASLTREATYSTLRLGLYEPYKNLISKEQNTSFLTKFSAGLLSGSTGAIFANPCDLLKIRLQSLQGNHSLINEGKLIIQNEGFLGLYKGATPNLARAAILTGTQMATYDQTKQWLMRNLNYKEGLQLQFVSSIVTGFMLTITTSPVDLIKTRIMSQESGKRVYSGLFNCAAVTIKQEGLGAFYKGFLPQWMRFGPFMIIQFIVWEQLRTFYGIKNI